MKLNTLFAAIALVACDVVEDSETQLFPDELADESALPDGGEATGPDDEATPPDDDPIDPRGAASALKSPVTPAHGFGCPFNQYLCHSHCLSVGHNGGYCKGFFKQTCKCYG
jgi:hypothetical protein